MSAREEILGRLNAGQRAVSPPPAWRSRRSFGNLAHRFLNTLRANKGEAYHETDLPAAFERLDQLVKRLEAVRIVANDEPPLQGLAPASLWPEREWYVAGQTEGEWRQLCAEADLGVSGARAALAETGSVVLGSGPGQSRLATLLPPVHIALVAHSQLTTDIFTWLAARDGLLPANLVLVGGPSKTADIEQTLAVGVHGPKQFIVVLYDD